MKFPNPDHLRIVYEPGAEDDQSFHRKRFHTIWPVFPVVPEKIKTRIEDYLNDPGNIVQAMEDTDTYADAARLLKLRAFEIWNWAC